VKHLSAIVIALVLVALPAAAAELKPGELIDWSSDQGAKQEFVSGDLTLDLQFAKGGDGGQVVTLTIEKPGSKSVEVTGEGTGSFGGQLGVVPLDSNGLPTVLFAVFTGGAHCCMQTTAVTETANGWVSAEVGIFNGAKINVADKDGDGTVEIVASDDRFLYVFDSYAGSYAPPLFYKSRDGEIYDASAEPQFRPEYEAVLADARKRCSGDTWELGSCAGLLAAAARLGTYEAESAPVFAAIKAGRTTSGLDSFTLCLDEKCEKTRDVPDFAEAVAASLKSWGYLPA